MPIGATSCRRLDSVPVPCPSGRRSMSRKHVWACVHRGFKSHRYRQVVQVRTAVTAHCGGGFCVSGLQGFHFISSMTLETARRQWARSSSICQVALGHKNKGGVSFVVPPTSGARVAPCRELASERVDAPGFVRFLQRTTPDRQCRHI